MIFNNLRRAWGPQALLAPAAIVVSSLVSSPSLACHNPSLGPPRVASADVLRAVADDISTEASAASLSGSSGGGKRVFVSGNSTFSTTCGLAGASYAILLTGDLEGCLSSFVESYSCKELADYDLYREKGREVFVGKYHGKSGRFRTTYVFDGAYAKPFCQTFDTTLEVGGGCSHPFEGRSGVFEGTNGLLKFIDVIAGVTGNPVTGEYTAGTGGNNFLYYGHLNFYQD